MVNFHKSLVRFDWSTHLTPNQLRLLYECNPMAYLMEQAGGSAMDGEKPVLDIQPTSIHQRAPIFMGSSEDVADVMAIIRRHREKGRKSC